MQKEEKEFLILLAKMFANNITNVKPKVITGKETIVSNTPNSTATALAGKGKTKNP